MEIKKTDIYEINEQLVAADTIEKAIAIYREVNRGRDIMNVTFKETDVLVSHEEPLDLDLDLSNKDEDNKKVES